MKCIHEIIHILMNYSLNREILTDFQNLRGKKAKLIWHLSWIFSTEKKKSTIRYVQLRAWSSQSTGGRQMTCRESPGNQPSYVKIHTAQLVKQDKGLSRKKVSKGGVGDMLTLESLKVHGLHWSLLNTHMEGLSLGTLEDKVLEERIKALSLQWTLFPSDCCYSKNRKLKCPRTYSEMNLLQFLLT